MTKVTVEANAATDVVEAIYPASLGDSVAAGRYAVTGVDDYCVALGFVWDRTTATFVPPPAPAAATVAAQIADLQAQLDALKAANGLG